MTNTLTIEQKNKLKKKYLDSLRKRRLGRKHERCECCSDEQNLTFHHCLPKEMGGTLRLDNLITLCESCHIFLHQRFGPGNNYTGPLKPKETLQALRAEMILHFIIR